MYKNKRVYAVVLAAGKGTRIGFDKMLYRLDRYEVAHHSISKFQENEYVDCIIVAAGENYEEIKQIAGRFPKVKTVVKGGATRALSVLNALEAIETDGIVAIHDGARPFVSQRVINAAIDGAFTHNAAVPCVKVKDTIKVSDGGFIDATPDRNSLYITQTPQAFSVSLYKKLAAEIFDDTITDDAQLFEKAGVAVKITPGAYENYKITTIDDIKKETKMRIGHGYDVHKLV